MTEKMNKEREHLRKMLAEYKEKITILTKAIFSSKKQKE